MSGLRSARDPNLTLDERLKILYPMVNEDETPLPKCWSFKDKFNYIGLSQASSKKKGQKRPEPFNKFSSLFRIIYELYTKDTAKLPKMPLQCVQHTSFQPHVVFTIMRSKLFPKAVMDTWASVFQSVLLVLTDYPAGTVVLMGITATTATHFVEVEQDKYLTSKFDLKHNLIWSQLYRFMVQLSPLAMS